MMAMTAVRHNRAWDWSKLHTYCAGGRLVKATAAEWGQGGDRLGDPQHPPCKRRLDQLCLLRGRQDAEWTRPNVLSRKCPSVPMAARARISQKECLETVCMS